MTGLAQEGARNQLLALACALTIGAGLDLRASPGYGFGEARAFLDRRCAACHSGESAASGFRTDILSGIGSFSEQPDAWISIASRVSNNEMPPDGATKPPADERTRFLEWLDATWRSRECSAGLRPVPARLRRLNRDEYSATVRDLFDIQVDVREMFPEDGPGGEGFDNAAETLFVSPLLAEKYLEVAKFLADVASKEFKSRRRLFVAYPGDGVSEPEAARRVLAGFLPRAFRRPVPAATVGSYVALFRKARRRGLDFEPAIFFALESVLVSPAFVFHLPSLAGDPHLRQYALASRLSYFLWGTMPDEGCTTRF